MDTNKIDTTNNSAGCSPCTPEAHQRAGEHGGEKYMVVATNKHPLLAGFEITYQEFFVDGNEACRVGREKSKNGGWVSVSRPNGKVAHEYLDGRLF